MKTFSVMTLGCKVNSYESEGIINDLISHGYILKKFNEICDIYIINTCTVTSMSDQKSRHMIRNAKKRNPDAVVVAMGCYTQLLPNQAIELADIVLGTNNKLACFDEINNYLINKDKILHLTDVLSQPTYEDMKINNLNTHTRGFIKIQDGCENYCSYCAIPYSRGKIRSRNPESIINEIKELVASGTKEVIISGINTGTYGQDLKNINLAKLIERIMEETSLFRLRMSSIELKEISDELLDIIKKYEDRIAHHFHIPLQAGSDTVLKRMNRKYNMAEYKDIIRKIRSLFGNVALTTDILAGFVGETEAEFKELLTNLKEINFYEMHVFPYSKRMGTKAYDMEGHIDEKIKDERSHILLDLSKEMRKNYIDEQIHQVFSIIVENKKNGYYHGHTSNYLDVYFKSDEELVPNSIVNVEIIDYIDDVIYGKVVK